MFVISFIRCLVKETCTWSDQSAPFESVKVQANGRSHQLFVKRTSRITQELLEGFPPNLGAGWISAHIFVSQWVMLGSWWKYLMYSSGQYLWVSAVWNGSKLESGSSGFNYIFYLMLVSVDINMISLVGEQEQWDQEWRMAGKRWRHRWLLFVTRAGRRFVL